MVKKIQYIPVLFVLGFMISAGVPQGKGQSSGIKTIVIDAGHGGKDPGCLGSIYKEKDVSLAVALMLGKYIESNLKEVKVIYTRTKDVFVELEDRAQIANKAKADLFISIHCNAAGKPVLVKDPKTGKVRTKMYRNSKGRLVTVETTNPVPYGSETYVMGMKNEEGKMKVATRENSAIFLEDDYEKKYGGFDPESEESYIIMSNYTSAYVIQSANLAMKIQQEYAAKAGRIDKGVHRQSIWVLWRTSMPSILTELGYLTNPLEEAFLGSDKGQTYLAKTLFRGLRRYKDDVEGTKKEYNDEFENIVALENENIKAGNTAIQKKPGEEDEAIIPIEIIPEETHTTTPQNQKEKVNDSKYSEIGIKKKDSIKPEGDSAVKAADIVAKFKKESAAKDGKDKEVMVVPSNKIIPANKVVMLNKDIFFKVQFASSDVELNLKQAKFSKVIDADFYKVDSVLKYTSGKFIKLKDAQAHQAFLREKGFKDCFVIAMKNGQRIEVGEAKKLLGQ